VGVARGDRSGKIKEPLVWPEPYASPLENIHN